MNHAYRIRPEVLDKIRANHQLRSDEELAHYLGLTLGTVSNLRRGKQPSVPTLMRVLTAADVSSISVAVSGDGAGVAA